MVQYGQYTVPPASEMVNFKVGQPAPTMLPLKRLRECAAKKFDEEDPLFLQYGFIPGYPEFREDLSKFLSEQYKTTVPADELFITNGVTGALAFTLGLMFKEGDVVFSEEPTYFLAKSIFNDFRLKLTQIPMDENGLVVDELEKKLIAGEVPKFVYTIPTAHNPTGRTLPADRRAKLVDLAEKYNFMILADEVYQLLTFPHIEAPPPMMTFDKGRGKVLSMSSFSKIMAPALRLGWLWADKTVLKPFLESGQMDSSGGYNPVIQGLVHQAIKDGFQKEHVAWSQKTLWSRAEVLMDALKKSLPDECSFEVPQGGYFIIVKCPVGTNTVALNEFCMAKHKIQFLPGAGFGASMTNYFRLSFSYYDPEGVKIGAERLGTALREFLADPEACSQNGNKRAKLW